MKTLACTLLALLFCLRPAFAEDATQPQVRLAAYKVATVRDGHGTHEIRSPLEQLRPGDTVEYEATYTNRSEQTVRNVQLNVPVPSGGLEYVAAPASPMPHAASIDGSAFAAVPLTRVEKAADGKSTTKAVPLAEYRVLRWSLGDLPPGATRSVRVRMHMPALASSATGSPSVASAGDTHARSN